MRVGSVITKQLTKDELIELINKTYADYGKHDVACVLTEVRESYTVENYDNRAFQSVTFTELFDV